MAKILVTKRDHRPIRLQPHVREVRKRYERALQMGYSKEEAARLANEGRDPVARVMLNSAAKEEALRKKIVALSTPPSPAITISGQASPERKTSRDDIPPNWEDLPWPRLRDLADRFSDKRVRSRAEAARAIESALASS